MIRRLFSSVMPVILGLIIIMTPVAAQAFSPFGGVDCSKASDSAVCSEHSSGNPLTGPDGVIVKAANIVAIIAGIAAVILIIIGGLKYVTSGGDSNAVGSAKNTVLYALVGLVVIAVAKILITFVVSRL